MKITIISVGKTHSKDLQAAISEYEQRLRQYIGALHWEFIPTSEIASESQQILKRLKGTIILLDETGHLINTPQFAEKLEAYQNTAVKQLTFIIGGAYGVTDDIKNRADYTWSLSPLVFPHQLVRLILVEQLYRAYDILAGGKYHHS